MAGVKAAAKILAGRAKGIAKNAAKTAAQRAARSGAVKRGSKITREMTQQAGKMIKNHPKLAALGISAAGIASYAVASGQTVKEATTELIKAGAEEAKDIVQNVTETSDDIICDVSGICIGNIFENIQDYAMYAGIILGFILLLFIFKQV